LERSRSYADVFVERKGALPDVKELPEPSESVEDVAVELQEVVYECEHPGIVTGHRSLRKG
jgi:hypothetical protein